MADERGVLIRRGGSAGVWSAPETTAYEAEDHLQSVLASSPERIPGVSAEARAARELSTSGGFVDVCIVDVDGRLTVVECKLASNSEKRRMVIGQVIDYAAALWRDGEDAFLDAWRKVGGDDLSAALSPTALGDFRRNLADGRINLCLAVDRIDADLRRLVEFLNRITLPEVSVTAIQLSYARDGDVEILVPRTFGGEIAEAKLAPTARRDSWTTATFLDAIVDAADRSTAEWLLRQVEASGSQPRDSYPSVWYGARPGGGVFLHPWNLRYAPIQMWVNKAGRLMMYGNWGQYDSVKAHAGFEELATLLGQDFRGAQRGMPVSSLNRDELWAVALRCAEVINAVDEAPPSS